MLLSHGDKFGRLTAIKPLEKALDNCRIWLFQCECGKFIERSATRMKSAHKKGKISSCGCYRSEIKRNNFKKPCGEAARNKLIACYKRNAKEKEIDFLLSSEECENFFKGNCHYCGSPPCRIISYKRYNGQYLCNGIDRKDSNQGYYTDNCVSCCTFCNFKKRNTPYNEFCDWINKVYKNLNHNG